MWYPRGVKAFVHGRLIPGGFIYIGPPGAQLGMIRASSIDPILPIAEPAPGSLLDRPGTATRYEDFSPQQRALYLEWLGTGRSNPLYNEQYVYTYLFGLEYRIAGLRDELNKAGDRPGPAKLIFEREGPVLRDELQRLLQAYADRPVLKTNIDSVLTRLTRALEGPEPVPVEPTASERRAQAFERTQIEIAQAPRPPAQRWYRQGEMLKVRGRTISSGLLYAGAPDPLVDAREPSAIDPASPGGPGFSAIGKTLAFKDLYLSDQDLYIDWHAEGRPIVMAGPWMVELFLWGLERRVMFEGWHYGMREAWTDLPEIEACLVDMTRSGGRRRPEPEWRKTAINLLQKTRILRVLTGQTTLDTLDTDPAKFNPSHRAAIYDLRGEPWPEELAFTLLQEGHRANPDFFRAHPPLAKHLFHLHYDPAVHGRCPGHPTTKELALSYIPASPALQQLTKFVFPELVEPDLKGARMLPALNVLWKIQSAHAVAVFEILGESPSELGMTWQFLLPAEQRSKELLHALDTLKRSIEEESPVSMVLAGLMANLGCNVPRKSHHLLCCFADALDQAGIGLEPDPRETDRLPPREMIVTPFRCAPGSPRSLSPSGVLYGKALAVIDWIAIKLNLDLFARTLFASECISSLWDVPANDRARLQIQSKAGKHRAPRKGAEDFAGINASLKDSHRAFIEREFQALNSKLFLERRVADRRLRSLYTSGLLAGAVPVTRAPATRRRHKVVLDEGRIKEIIEETERAGRILAPIFATPDDAPAIVPLASAHPWGLDAHHAGFLAEMAAAVPMAIELAMTIARRHDLMFDGAVERINEAAIEHAGEPMFEVDGDRVEQAGAAPP